MKTDLLDYHLPEELIALYPPEERDGGRLLTLCPDNSAPHHGLVRDLPFKLAPGTLLLLNDTRVIPARLRGRRPTGGAVEILLVRALEEGETQTRWSALLRANRPIRPGDTVEVDGAAAVVESRGERGEATLCFEMGGAQLRQFVNEVGEVPLPPYIRRHTEPCDTQRYQSIFARFDGSVAAPTASLHFTASMLEKAARRGVEISFVTLHVGPGTFRPISAEDTSLHVMDAEQYVIGEKTATALRRAKGEGRPVVAVGTTTTRAIEGAMARHGEIVPCIGDTELFIEPGYELKVIDGLLTNFHLPRSTLLCLVSALVGRERLLRAYEEAVALRYRFYSYGDAMLIAPQSALVEPEEG
ncbi:MAG: tRNA preQ1(34) S-adenosylmethionine ribosyltransferase-isomerase QueA [Myxococcota bacterium]|nr:tRNA preQ1(34) S-adenosylmethionine ribosyltransferase-isomerase QueA [Myxococcota bacterium]